MLAKLHMAQATHVGTEQAARGDRSGLCSFVFFFLGLFSCDIMTRSWRTVSERRLTALFLGQFARNFDSCPTAKTASGITDLAETTTGLAQAEAVAHFP